MATAAELTYTAHDGTGANALALANAMFGNGVTVNSATYTGFNQQIGTFGNGDALASGATPSDTGVIFSTGNIADYTQSSGDTNQSAGTSSSLGGAGDADLTAVSGQSTFDAAILEGTFTPTGNTLTMQFTFSSDEYLEYANGSYNDSFAVWVNGVKAEMSFTTDDVTINSINDVDNPNLYKDNPAGTDNFNTEMDGLTVTLSLKVPTIPNQPNTFKFAIADGGDESFDTNVLIAADSVQTVLIASGDSITAPLTGTKSIDVLANDTTSSGTAMTITHINDIPVSIGDTVTLPSGEQVTLLPSGHLDIQGTGVAGTTAVFTYTVEDAVGNTDVDFVEITNNIPCFTAGTLFETQNGQTPIEQLVAGDMIKNASGDWKKLLWVGYRCIIPETGTHPIRISKGTLGALCDIEVSPNHRLLLKGYMAEMLFGVDEVLVAAKHLINDHSIRAVTEATEVTYFHLAFADHEILNTSGLESESFFIGDQSLDALLSEQRSEIMSKFPELFAQNVMDLQTARTCLKFHEGAVLATVLNSGAQTTVKP